MHSLVFVGLALAAVLLRTGFVVYRAWTSPTYSIPGPTAARFTRLWYFARLRRGDFHHENISLHATYGPIVRVAPGWFSISTPDKAVYGIGSKFRKSDWYQGWKHPSPDRWTLFPDQDMRRHAETRKRFQALYSLSSLVSYEPYVDDCDDMLLERLGAVAESGEVVDMVHWFQCYAFDVMSSITYSKRFGFLDRGDDIAGIMAALQRSMVYSTLVGVYPWAHPWLYAIMEKIPGSGAAGRTFLMQFVRETIRARSEERAKRAPGPAKEKQTHVDNDDDDDGDQSENSGPQDFLDKLTRAHERDPAKVTPYHIFMMGLSNIIAGSDTTAISLSSMLMHLITSPASMARLRDEVSAVQAAGATGSGGHISFKTANTAMPYLQAVIKEALRLHPATGLPLWRVVPEGGAVVAGQRFEEGDVVGLNSWVAHYDKNVYGDDAYAFRPERWLEVDEQRVREMDANFMPVGFSHFSQPAMTFYSRLDGTCNADRHLLLHIVWLGFKDVYRPPCFDARDEQACPGDCGSLRF